MGRRSRRGAAILGFGVGAAPSFAVSATINVASGDDFFELEAYFERERGGAWGGVSAASSDGNANATGSVDDSGVVRMRRPAAQQGGDSIVIVSNEPPDSSRTGDRGIGHIDRCSAQTLASLGAAGGD
jgi:hypothetical protein